MPEWMKSEPMILGFLMCYTIIVLFAGASIGANAKKKKTDSISMINSIQVLWLDGERYVNSLNPDIWYTADGDRVQDIGFGLEQVDLINKSNGLLVNGTVDQ